MLLILSCLLSKLVYPPVYTSIGTSSLKTSLTETPRGFKHCKCATVTCQHISHACYVSGRNGGPSSISLSRPESECVLFIPRSISKSIPISAISCEDNGADPEVDHREEEMEEVDKGKQNLGAYEKNSDSGRSQSKVNSQQNRQMVERQQQKHPLKEGHQRTPKTPGGYILLSLCRFHTTQSIPEA